MGQLLALITMVVIPASAAAHGHPTPAPTPGQASALQVVDSNGKIVGPYYSVSPFGGDFVIRQINGTRVQLAVGSSGFETTGNPLFYSGPDCTGTEYVSGTENELSWSVSNETIFGNILYYPSTPSFSEEVTVCSQQDPDGECVNSSGCGVGSGYAPAASFDLSTLGLVPPFSLK